MNILITFTTIGVDAGPFNLYSDVDGYLAAFEIGVTSVQLLAGFPSPNAPDGTTIVKAKSLGVCTNEVFVNVTGASTTTTTSTLPLVLPVVGSCCGGVTTEYILYDPIYSVGSVIASTSEGFLGGYEVTGLPVSGTPTLVLYDATDYNTCPNFLAFWGGFACI